MIFDKIVIKNIKKIKKIRFNIYNNQCNKKEIIPSFKFTIRAI